MNFKLLSKVYTTYKHKYIDYRATNGDMKGNYYLLKLGDNILGLANLRNGKEFMFKVDPAAAQMYIDMYVLANIVEVLQLLNKKHGLKVDEDIDSNQYEY